jgi:hypothetical protein
VTKIDWDKFWAIFAVHWATFSQKHLVALLGAHIFLLLSAGKRSLKKATEKPSLSGGVDYSVGKGRPTAGLPDLSWSKHTKNRRNIPK